MRAEQLWDQFCERTGLDLDLATYAPSGLPDGEYRRIPLEELTLANPKNFDITGSVAWLPVGKEKSWKAPKFTVNRAAQDCVFYFLQIPKQGSFEIKSPGHSLLNLSARHMIVKARLTGVIGAEYGPCSVLIGENVYSNGGQLILDRTDVLIGHGGLWSDNVLLQGSNQHGVIEMPSRRLVDYGRNRIVCEPHVWLGRRSLIMAGSHIEQGSIIGAGAVSTKRYPICSVVVGNPGKVLPKRMSWCRFQAGPNDFEATTLAALAEQIESEKSPPPPRLPWREKLYYVAGSALIGGLAATAVDGLF